MNEEEKHLLEIEEEIRTGTDPRAAVIGYIDEVYEKNNADLLQGKSPVTTRENPEGEPTKPVESKFHQHLDECDRCRNNPMDLCATGLALLRDEIAAEEKTLEEKYAQDPTAPAYFIPNRHDRRRAAAKARRARREKLKKHDRA
ncbi:MAG: hypothetical protein ACYC36_00230 [Bellilinea sp.]